MKKILLFIIILFFTVSSKSGDFDLYGNIGMAGWWMRSERFYDDSVEAIDTIYTSTDTTIIFRWDKDSIPMIASIIKPIGKFGGKFKSDRVGGCIEIGVQINSYDFHLSGVSASLLPDYQKRSFWFYLRKWYVEWYINDYFTFLAGQDYAPTNFFPSNHAFNGGTGLNNVGCIYTGRYPMFKFSAGNQLGIEEPTGISWAVKAAVIKIDTSVIEYFNKSGHDVKYHCETKLPKLEGGASLNFERNIFALNVNVAGGYQTYTSVIYKANIPEKNARLSVHSGVVSADLGIKIGMLKVAVDALYGRNIGAYGVWIGDEFGWWRIADFMRPFFPIHTPVLDSNGIPTGDGEMRNGIAFAIAGMINVKPMDFFALEFGGGHVRGEHDWEPYNDRWDPTYAWYFQVEAEILEHLKLTPEIGQYIYGPHRGFGRYFYGGFNFGVEF